MHTFVLYAGGRDQPTELGINHLLQLNNKLDILNSNFEILDKTLSQHKQQTAAELAQLQASLSTTQSSLEQLHIILSQHKQETAAELIQLHNKMTITATQLSTYIQETHTNLSDVECMDLEECLQLHQNLQDNVTCQQETVVHDVSAPHTCGGTGGWRRVVYLNMTDLSTTCPFGWQPTGYLKRTCGRATFGQHTCDSVTFPVSGGEYSRVCGRIKAYQWGITAAFRSYYIADVTSIDGAYVDGISLTHNDSRQHIWTFAAGVAEGNPSPSFACPCDSSRSRQVPPFVGNDYFCESGVNEPWDSSKHYSLHSNDTLWDGENCLPSSTCCSLHNPPYFVKQLPTPTTDDIEARICLKYPQSQDIAVELVDLYVQ